VAYDALLADRIRTQLKRRKLTLEEKAMMGGLAFMVDGKMCLGVEKNRLMARLDPAIYEEALRRRGCQPMDFTGRPLKGFVFVRPDGVKTSHDLRQWVDLALEFNPNAKTSRKMK